MMRPNLAKLLFAISLTLVVFAGRLSSQNTTDDDGSQVLDDCIAEMGGRMVLASAANLHLRGQRETTLAENSTSQLEIYLHEMCRHSIAVNRSGQKSEWFSDGKSLWSFLDEKPSTVQTNPYLPINSVPWPGVMAYWKSSSCIKSMGVVDFDGRPCFKVLFEDSHGKKFFRYFDKETLLPVGWEFNHPTFGNFVKIFEFKKLDDIYYPLHHTAKLGGRVQTTSQFELVSSNMEFESSRFEMPKSIKELSKTRAKGLRDN